MPEVPSETVRVRSKHIQDKDSLDIFLFAAPGSTREDEREQFRSMALQALAVLSDRGLSPSTVVMGQVHFAKAPTWSWREALAELWQMQGPLPITALVQPPAEPFCFCTMQVHAIRTARQSGVWYGNSAEPFAATVLRSGARHLRLTSILPRPDLIPNASMVDLTYDMLAQAGHALTARGLSFADVVRTWIHVEGIDRHYAAINQARNRYFREQQMVRLPASTCVEGRPLGSSPVTMDLYAVGSSASIDVQSLRPGRMGEATTYGSSFARATQLREPDRTTIYVSGTASIDGDGAVVAPDDLGGQLTCMFDNVETILAESEMTMGHVVSGKAYLKHADGYGDFLAVARARGLDAVVPVAVVEAAICRPEWLCEIEVCAVRGTR